MSNYDTPVGERFDFFAGTNFTSTNTTHIFQYPVTSPIKETGYVTNFDFIEDFYSKRKFNTDITCPLAYWQEEINIGETETSLTGGVYGVNTPIPEEMQKSQYYNVLLDLIEYIKVNSSHKLSCPGRDSWECKYKVTYGAIRKTGTYEGPQRIGSYVGFAYLYYDDTYIYIYGVPSHGKYKTKYITIYDEDFLDNYIPEK